MVVCAARAASGALPPCARRARLRAVAAAGAAAPGPAAGAASLVESGLASFAAGRHDAAVAAFTAALAASPSEDEARAAHYNRACAFAALRRYDDACSDVAAAVNERRLRYSVVAADGDLAALRATPAFARLLPTLVGAPRGATSSGAASPAGAAAAAPPPPSLVAEARSPFRLLRLFFLAALLGGALIASVVTLPRLAAALGGREGAPEAGATGLNAAVDAAVLAASALLLQRELRAKADDEKRAGDEETVAGLRVLLQPPAPAGAPAAGAPPPPPQPASLRSLRGSLRPVLCAGFHGSARAVGERAREVGPALAARGLLLVLLDDAGDGEGDGGGGGGDEDAGGLAGAARAKGFGAAPARPAAPAAPSAASAAPPFAPAWQARPEGGAEWRAWAAGARASLVLPPGAALFCALDLDGAIVLQGPGPPPLEQLLKQTPTLEKQGARKGANAQAAR